MIDSGLDAPIGAMRRNACKNLSPGEACSESGHLFTGFVAAPAGLQVTIIISITITNISITIIPGKGSSLGFSFSFYIP